MQVEQVQVLEVEGASGFFKPAAPQSNALTVGAGGGFGAAVGAGFEARGASQIVHCSVAEAGLLNMHIEHVQVPPGTCVGAFIPAAPKLNATGAGLTGATAGGGTLKSKVGSDAFETARAASRAFCELGPGPAPGDEVGISKVYDGSSAMGVDATIDLTSSFVFATGLEVVDEGVAFGGAGVGSFGMAGTEGALCAWSRSFSFPSSISFSSLSAWKL